MSALDIVLIALLVLILCAAIGFAIAWSRARSAAEVARANVDAANAMRVDALERLGKAENTLAEAQARLESATADAAKSEQQTERMGSLQHDLDETCAALETARDQLAQLNNTNALLQQDMEFTNQRKAEIAALLDSTRTTMAEAFQGAASAVLEAKSKTLTEQNKAALDVVLTPFNTQLNAFKTAVEETHKTDIRERSSLKTELEALRDLNKTLNTQAQSLTDALRGQSKARGTWGERILVNVLEASGLREGYEFHTQKIHHDDDGKRLQPDVVVNLPDERFVIIDSKLSLLAYERYVSASDEDARAAALRAHVASVSTHVNELSRKDYVKLYGLKTLDFVLMFVPITSALLLAQEVAPELDENAFNKRVSLVSPNTLGTILRAIDYTWRADRTSKNMKNIWKLGGQLYESAVLFAQSMEDIGKHLANAKDAHEQARGRLLETDRSLLRRAERLKALGIKTQKAMPKSVQDDLAEDSTTTETGRLLSLESFAGDALATDDCDAESELDPERD